LGRDDDIHVGSFFSRHPTAGTLAEMGLRFATLDRAAGFQLRFRLALVQVSLVEMDAAGDISVVLLFIPLLGNCAARLVSHLSTRHVMASAADNGTGLVAVVLWVQCVRVCHVNYSHWSGGQ
jgi:hypothetical protein